MHTHSHPTHLLNHLSFHTDESFSLVSDFEGWGDAGVKRSKVDQVFKAQTANGICNLNGCQQEIKYITFIIQVMNHLTSRGLQNNNYFEHEIITILC